MKRSKVFIVVENEEEVAGGVEVGEEAAKSIDAGRKCHLSISPIIMQISASFFNIVTCHSVPTSLDVPVFREAGTRGCVPREGGHYKCKCKRGFAGRYCERGETHSCNFNLKLLKKKKIGS